MPGFVKTKSDEKKWKKAVKIAKKRAAAGKADSVYALANHIFHNMKRTKGSGRKRAEAAVVLASKYGLKTEVLAKQILGE